MVEADFNSSISRSTLRRICTLRSRRRSRLKAAAYSSSISLPQDG